MGDVEIRVEGLAELRRDLKKAERLTDLAEFRDGLKKATEIGANEAASLAGAFSHQAADTIRPRAGGNVAYIVGGKASLPWYGWADFGQRTARTGQPRSVGPWANSGKGPKRGRFIYEGVERKSHEITEAVADAVEKAMKP